MGSERPVLAYWDASSLVPLCVVQRASQRAVELLARFDIATWWGTSIEVESAFARIARMGDLPDEQYVTAKLQLQALRLDWYEVEPEDAVRSEAVRLLQHHPLKATDALQLAAALRWAKGSPVGRVFLSGDRQLVSAARRVGLTVVAT